MTRIRDLKRKIESLEKREESDLEPLGAWRMFIAGDFDPETPPEPIRLWLEKAAGADWERGEWPPYIVHPRWTGTATEWRRWTAFAPDWREPNSSANPEEIIEEWSDS
jgi:hypothetical protein